MNLILLGPPGAGKGTTAVDLSKIISAPHISTGEIFRDNIKAATEMGKLADRYISKGCLVPDEVTCRIVEERIEQSDCCDGFILDGFPRTIVQARVLDEYLIERSARIDYVINIVVSEPELLKRLTNRRICSVCKGNYNLRMQPELKDVCPACGGKLTQRDDDRVEVIRKRFVTYHEETEPLIEYYRSNGILRDVRSESTIDGTLVGVLKAIGLGNNK